MSKFAVVLLCFIGSSRASEFALRVVGGDPVPENAFPFVASLYLGVPAQIPNDDFRCTGSIIHERWILSAAHCLVDETLGKKLSVRVGEIVTNDDAPKLEIEEIHAHPKYVTTTSILWNDIALIKLKEPLVWSASVRPIALGSVDEENEVDLRYIGFGNQHTVDFRLKRRLNTIVLKTVKFEECKKIHAKLENTVDKPTHICVFKAINKTLCFGDSGGPLIDPKTNKQVGIFSGLQDCTGRYPVLFTKISHFLPWIISVTKISI